MNERQREEEKEKPKSANITACKDKTWDRVFTFATSQLLHCYEQLIISGFKCITSKTCLYTHYDTELCNLTLFCETVTSATYPIGGKGHGLKCRVQKLQDCGVTVSRVWSIWFCPLLFQLQSNQKDSTGFSLFFKPEG